MQLKTTPEISLSFKCASVMNLLRHIKVCETSLIYWNSFVNQNVWFLSKPTPLPPRLIMRLWKEPLLKDTLNWNTLRLKCDTKVFMSFFTFDINPFTLFPTYAPLAWLLSKELKDMNVYFQTLKKSSRFKKGSKYSETFIITNDQLCSAQNSTI